MYCPPSLKNTFHNHQISKFEFRIFGFLEVLYRTWWHRKSLFLTPALWQRASQSTLLSLPPSAPIRTLRCPVWTLHPACPSRVSYAHSNYLFIGHQLGTGMCSEAKESILERRNTGKRPESVFGALWTESPSIPGAQEQGIYIHCSGSNSFPLERAQAKNSLLGPL